MKKTPSDKKVKSTEIKDKMYWWLNKNRTFYLEDKYAIDLLDVPGSHGVKILITKISEDASSSDAPSNNIGSLSKIDG